MIFLKRVICIASLYGLLATGIRLHTASAQNAPKGGSVPAPAAGGDSSAPPSGFSIESEMLTYSAMQAESKAIACEIARYKGLANANDENCKSVSGGASQVGVVVLPSDSGIFADFQIWSADIVEMDLLGTQARISCHETPPAPPPSSGSSGLGPPGNAVGGGGTGGGGGGATGTGGAGIAVPLANTPIGQAISLAQSAYTTSESLAPVSGNIRDQALVNGVAHRLREMGIAVLVPDLYMPYSLERVDMSQSPFMDRLIILNLERKYCAMMGIQNADAEQAAIAIDSFISAVTGTPPQLSPTSAETVDRSTLPLQVPPASEPGQQPGGTTGSGRQGAGGTANTNGSGSPGSIPSSHLLSVLRADGLARAILGQTGMAAAVASNPNANAGTTPNPASSQSGPFQYVLWLKALESGGSVTRIDHAILGVPLPTHFSYSGGAVVTFSLFGLDGQVQCAGTVFDFAGAQQDKAIEKRVHEQNTPPLLEEAGGCGPAVK